jgi:pimeloyl-ACP methyl ester carboxylesterase
MKRIAQDWKLPFRFPIVGIVVFALTVLSASRAACQSPAKPERHHDYLNVGTKLYYEECGAGPAVVLLHDGLLGSPTWNDVWPILCGKYHVVRYDRRGYGKSEAPKEKFSQTEDLYKLMEHLQFQRVVIVGNSSGGEASIEFALAHPEMTEGLFLVGAVVGGMEATARFEERGKRSRAPGEKGDMKQVALNSKAIRSRSHSEMVN